MQSNKTNEIVTHFHKLAKISFVLVIQSRIQVHYKLKNEFKKYIPDCKFKINNIAVLTVIGGKKYHDRYKNSIELRGYTVKKIIITYI